MFSDIQVCWIARQIAMMLTLREVIAVQVNPDSIEVSSGGRWRKLAGVGLNYRSLINYFKLAAKPMKRSLASLSTGVIRDPSLRHPLLVMVDTDQDREHISLGLTDE